MNPDKDIELVSRILKYFKEIYEEVSVIDDETEKHEYIADVILSFKESYMNDCKLTFSIELIVDRKPNRIDVIYCNECEKGVKFILGEKRTMMVDFPWLIKLLKEIKDTYTEIVFYQ